MSNDIICSNCKKELINDSDIYDYRGAFSCEDCLDIVQDSRERERQEIIAEEKRRLAPLKGMDINPNTVLGKINCEILKPQIEIACKESYRMKNYEGRGNQ